MRRAEDCLAELRAACGPQAVLAGSELPDRSFADYSGEPGARPFALLRPADTSQVAAMLRICQAHGQPVVPQGGLTGLAGGACCRPQDMALSLERMNRIEAVDEVSATLTAQAGCVLQVAQQAAADHGFLLALDLGARGSCTLGGNIATNAGGNRVIRYGTARDQLLGLEAVLADGRVVGGLHAMVKNNSGYDWRHLMAASEGTLGVITRLVFKLHPRPAHTGTAWCGLAGFDAATTLLRRARAELGAVSVFEVMWPGFLHFMLERAEGLRRPLAGEHGLHVLLESEGDAAAFEAFLARMLEEGVIEDAALAQSHAEAQALWAIRDATAGFPRWLPGMAAFDVSFPIRRIGEVAARCQALLNERWPGGTHLFFGHLGDGNLHVISHMAGMDEDLRHAIEHAVYDLTREFGGSVSAEHGIGTLKRKVLGHCRSADELAAMRSLKAALDPAGILNPGKLLV